MRFGLLSALALAFAASLEAQSPAPGLRIYGDNNATVTNLVDDLGTVVHTWNSTFRPGQANYVLPDGTLLRAINVGGPITIPGTGGGVQRVALDGTVLWDYRHSSATYTSHHDVHGMPNGNVLLIVWEQKTAAAAFAAGRNPAYLPTSPVFYPDSIVEVQPTGPTTGVVVWEWHLWDHLIQDFNTASANYGVVANHPELMDINYPPLVVADGDWNHSNGLDYDPIHDWVMLSVRQQNEIIILDHSTTTAQAAGHTGGRWGKGGDILYRWGNPEAYRRGTLADEILFGQHCPRFIPPGYPGAGNVTVFNNEYQTNVSAVHEFVLPVDANGNFILGPNGRYGPAAPLWTYTAPGFHSAVVSSAQRLPNGNTLICSGFPAGRMFEIDPSGTIVWQVNSANLVFQCNYVDRHLWADRTTLSVAAGGTVAFDLIAGTRHTNRAYLMLGSLSGTTPGIDLGPGLHLPLNYDLFTTLTLTSVNHPPFQQTSSFVNAQGRATAAFQVPAGFLPPDLVGLQMDFAYVVIDPATLSLTLTSNAVPVRIQS